MANIIVPQVYKDVIEDVVEKMAVQFVNMGLDESILTELQTIWESKLFSTRVADFTPVMTQNPAAAMGYSSSSTSSPGGPAQHTQQAVQAAMVANLLRQQQQQGIPSQQGSPDNRFVYSASNLAALAAANSNNPYRLPQNDGADDDSLIPTHTISPHKVSQLDGHDDEEEEEDDDEDGEGDINSDLDDEDSDDDQVETDHIVLCQYEKVTRIKNKWKCVLRDGVININGRDYLFNKANGDFEW